jgi:oligosaccharide repeat unit polymerase
LKIKNRTSQISYINKEVFLINFFWIAYACVNRLRLSDLQIDWSVIDFFKIILIFPVSTLIFYIIQLPRRQVNANEISFKTSQISIKKSFVVFVMVTSLLTMDFLVNGIPVLMASSSTELNDLRVGIRIPFFYTFSIISMNVLIIFLLFNKSTLKNMLLILLCIFFFILHSYLVAARGSAVYLLVGIGLYFILYHRISFAKKYILLFFCFILTIIFFDIAGSYREGQDFSIQDYGGFSSDLPSPVAWLWGYIVVNLDNLVIILNDSHSVFENKVLNNFSLTFFSSQGYDVSKFQDLPYIGRFNLSTGFGAVGYDFGYLGVVVFASLLLVFFNGLKKLSFYSLEWRVAYIFFTEALLIFPIGNWFLTSRGILIAISIWMISRFILVKREVR